MVASYLVGCAHNSRFRTFADFLAEAPNAFAQRFSGGYGVALFNIVASGFSTASQLAGRRSEGLSRADVKM